MNGKQIFKKFKRKTYTRQRPMQKKKRITPKQILTSEQ